MVEAHNSHFNNVDISTKNALEPHMRHELDPRPRPHAIGQVKSRPMSRVIAILLMLILPLQARSRIPPGSR
ncbi:hypothetical protein [Cupriavidus sp. L7L]|uniref:hypothetical protein n=1 Tax=Cupriavidus sp. L7L TaxID=2546443 RepID=UPI001404EC81|nr:hypothetical protein [Cupriavidus sp. L7L]